MGNPARKIQRPVIRKTHTPLGEEAELAPAVAVGQLALPSGVAHTAEVVGRHVRSDNGRDGAPVGEDVVPVLKEPFHSQSYLFLKEVCIEADIQFLGLYGFFREF